MVEDKELYLNFQSYTEQQANQISSGLKDYLENEFLTEMIKDLIVIDEKYEDHIDSCIKELNINSNIGDILIICDHLYSSKVNKRGYIYK